MNINHTFAICAYKESRHLEKCIVSLRKQTVKSKIIMITSTPNNYITEIAGKYGIELFVNENGGITEDWNYAYNKAVTDYVTITHQDDIYFPQYAKSVVDNMKERKKPIIGFSDYVEIRNDKKISSNKLLKIKRLMLMPLRISMFQKNKIVRRMILSLGCPICCPSVTFFKKNIEGNPFQSGFRSDEDWEAWEKLSRVKGDFVYVPKKLMGHRIHEESETTNILGDNARQKEDYIMYKKFWPECIAKRLAKVYSLSEKSNEL